MMGLRCCCEGGRDVKRLEEFDTPPPSSFGGLDYWLGGILSALGPRGLGGTEGAVENLSGLRPAPNNGS